jgi:hypothetical protein
VLQTFHARKTLILLVSHTSPGKWTSFHAITNKYAATANGSEPQGSSCSWKGKSSLRPRREPRGAKFHDLGLDVFDMKEMEFAEEANTDANAENDDQDSELTSPALYPVSISPLVVANGSNR